MWTSIHKIALFIRYNSYYIDVEFYWLKSREEGQ